MKSSSSDKRSTQPTPLSFLFVFTATTTLVATGVFGLFPSSPITQQYRTVIAQHVAPAFLAPVNGFLGVLGAPPIPEDQYSNHQENMVVLDPGGWLLEQFGVTSPPLYGPESSVVIFDPAGALLELFGVDVDSLPGSPAPLDPAAALFQQIGLPLPPESPNDPLDPVGTLLTFIIPGYDSNAAVDTVLDPGAVLLAWIVPGYQPPPLGDSGNPPPNPGGQLLSLFGLPTEPITSNNSLNPGTVIVGWLFPAQPVPSTTSTVTPTPTVSLTSNGTPTPTFSATPTATVTGIATTSTPTTTPTSTPVPSKVWWTAMPTSTATPPDAAPYVVNTSPSNGGTGVSPSANIVITFSEPVNVAASGIALVYYIDGPVNVSATVSGSGTNQIILDPVGDMPADRYHVEIYAALISDTDLDDPPDTLSANYSFYFDVSDTAPYVVSTSPYNGETGVSPSTTDIVITFSEPVNVSVAAVDLGCEWPGGGVGVMSPVPVLGSGTSVITLQPMGMCWWPPVYVDVYISAATITDTDLNDPPDTMAADYSFRFLVGTLPSPTPTPTPAPQFNVSAVYLNGFGSAFFPVSVAAGAPLTVTYNYQVFSDWCPGCVIQLVTGLGTPGSQGTTCAYIGIPGVSPGVSSSENITLTAPSTPGTYDVVVEYNDRANCTDALTAYGLAAPYNRQVIGQIVVP